MPKIQQQTGGLRSLIETSPQKNLIVGREVRTTVKSDRQNEIIHYFGRTSQCWFCAYCLPTNAYSSGRQMDGMSLKFVSQPAAFSLD